ncbi:hypothetical protein A2U01_0098421, partial [Trifolium medium]|nr:hypothetical protein [Trifolium medium]
HSVLRACRQARFCVAKRRSWWQLSPVVAGCRQLSQTY